MKKPSLPTSAADFARGIFGPADDLREVGSRTGTARTYLWTGGAASGYLKTYRSPRPFEQERAAYERWAPELRDVPQLLGALESPTPTIAITPLPGTPIARASLSVSAERGVHEAAGAWLRTLHDLAHVDEDPVAVRDAYRMRWSGSWEERAGSGPPDRLRAWVGKILQRALPSIEGARVPCHRDYQPANWLVDSEEAWVGVIDFEHARLDHPLADIARLAAYVWPDRSDLEHAFREGYGPLRDEEALRAFAVAEAWHRWRWARRHGDDGLAHSGLHALAALGAPVEIGDLS